MDRGRTVWLFKCVHGYIRARTHATNTTARCRQVTSQTLPTSIAMEPTKLLRLPERRGQKGLERPIHLLLARISGNSPKSDGSWSHEIALFRRFFPCWSIFRRTHLEAWRVGEGFRPSVCLSENLKIRGFRSSWYLHSPRVVDHGPWPVASKTGVGSSMGAPNPCLEHKICPWILIRAKMVGKNVCGCMHCMWVPTQQLIRPS